MSSNPKNIRPLNVLERIWCEICGKPLASAGGKCTVTAGGIYAICQNEPLARTPYRCISAQTVGSGGRMYELRQVGKQAERRRINESQIEFLDRYRKTFDRPHWIQIKHERADIVGNACERCSRSDVKLEGNHVNYDRIYPEFESLADIELLCRDCHALYHWNPWQKNRPAKDGGQGAFAFMMRAVKKGR